MKRKTITKAQAKALKYVPFSNAFKLPDEEWMLNKMIQDFDRVREPYALVAKESDPRSVIVWARPKKKKV